MRKYLAMLSVVILALGNLGMIATLDTVAYKEETVEDIKINKIPTYKEIKLKYDKLIKEKEVKKKQKKETKYREIRDITCYITYYYASNDSLQGGFNDKRGKRLSSHTTPICALPSNITYGSKLVLSEGVIFNTNKDKSKEFINVDTGGAIVWLDNNTCKVDVFIKNCNSVSWVVNNTKNCKVKGKLFIK